MTTRTSRGRRLLSFVVVAAVIGGFFAALPTPLDEASSALDAGRFNPGYIISDREFYNGAAMTEAEIQAFLNSQITGTCSGAGCLRDYRQNTTDKPQYFSSSSGQVECTAYTGAPNESAARIIFRVQQACGVSAKVLLVTLQKERGLVTKRSTIPNDWLVAMGYGCPDTAPCAEQYFGFFNQVWMAARQFKVYRASPQSFRHRAGQVANVLWHPNSACGSSPVFIENAATAALYNYTPYQPNAAALANLGGVGDACSSYGNRNFWVFYTRWFGDPMGQVDPIGNLDSVTSPAGGSVSVRGWAFDWDSSGPVDIHVYGDSSFLGSMTASLPRGDVQAAYPTRSVNAGFDGTFAVQPGVRAICAYAINVAFGKNSLLGCRTVTVATVPPAEPPADQSAAVYRFWSENNQTHFYTRSVAERDFVIRTASRAEWSYEGPMFGAFGTQVPGTVPLYRFWSQTQRAHFYTANPQERDFVINNYPDEVWKYEMVAFYVYPVTTDQPNTLPVTRFWSATKMSHFYTSNRAEADFVSANYPPNVWSREFDAFRVPSAVPQAAPLP